MNLNRNLKQTMVNRNQTMQFMTKATQTMRIKNLKCGGNLVIRGIQQKMVFKLNFKQLEESFDKTSFKNALKQAVKKTIDTNDEIKNEFMSGSGPNINETNITESHNVSEVVDSYSYNDFKKDLMKMDLSQDLDLGDYDIGGDCTIENISQDIQLDLVVNKISKRMTESFVQQMQTQDVTVTEKRKTKIESTGPIGEITRGIQGIIKEGLAGLTAPIRYAIIGGIALIALVLVGGIVVKLLRTSKMSGAQIAAQQQMARQGIAPTQFRGPVSQSMGQRTGMVPGMSAQGNYTVGGAPMFGGWA